MNLPPLNFSGFEFGIQHCTLVGWIIIGLLGVLSISSWAAMMSKWLLLGRVTRANRQFMRAFRDSPHPLALFLTKEHVDLSPMYHIYHHACRELAFHLVGEDQPGRTFAARLQAAGRITPSQMGAVQNAMERSVAETALRLEARMSVVATALSAAPFLGLLGTVWGVLDSFSELVNAAQGAGLQALAPGVSAALLTTVVGLLVAVPSMIGYNFLVNRIRGMIVRLDNFASELCGILDREFVDHRGTAEPLPSLGALGLPSMPAPSRSPTSPLPGGLGMATTQA